MIEDQTLSPSSSSSATPTSQPPPRPESTISSIGSSTSLSSDRIPLPNHLSINTAISSPLSNSNSQNTNINGFLSDGIRSDTESFVENELLDKRNLIEELINNNNFGQEGDLWYLISTEYLNKFINLEVSSFEELKSSLGPIDCSTIVDLNGNLYPEDNEPVGTYNISPEIFNYLLEWFGIKGDPITRCLIINDETGAKEVERFPPLFYIHQLGKKSQSQSSSYLNSRHSHNNHHHNHPIPISISRTKKFNDLLDMVRINILKSPKTSSINDFRIWFIDCQNLQALPQTITVLNFINDLTNKSLVQHSILNDSLKSQGINSVSYHILVESKDHTTKAFPIDTYLSLINFDQFDLDLILSKSGHLGLSNLGNTCYMNSALQCLLHVPEINYYFFYNLYKQELNVDNPLGNHGDVANVFGSLLKQAFDTNPSSSRASSSSISPREFKSTIGRYSSMFSGYLQQDSQEFLSWLLDALHEDLNRIHKKPYCEKPELKDDEINDPHAIVRLSNTCWDQHKQRNDSIIVDLFTGLYQSTLVCPDCSKTSITFDPFNDVTLPLPINKKWYHTFTIVDLSDEGLPLPQRIMKLEVELNKTSNYDELLNYLSQFLSVPSNQLFLFEIFRNSFYSDFQLDYQKNKFLPISDIIKDTDDVLVYYIPHDPDTDMTVLVYNTVEDPDKSYKVKDSFGIPLFITLNKDMESASFGLIREKLQQKASVLSKINIDEEYTKIKQESIGYVDRKFYRSEDFPLLYQGNTLHSSFKKEVEPAASIDDVVDEIDDEVKLDQEQDVEDEDDEGYQSDISLANPYVGANFGFTIKYSQNHFHKPHNNLRNRIHMESRASANTYIHVPLHKPNFSEFHLLADKLPELKRTYYHYPDYNSKLDQEMDDLAAEVDNGSVSSPTSDSTTKTNEEDGFILVENKDAMKRPPALPSRNLISQHSNSSDEDTESEPNLGSLFDSTTTLPLPALPYADSIKPSTANSPIDPPSGIASPKIEANVSQEALVNKDGILLCHWDYKIYKQLFGEVDVQTWADIPFLPNPELERNKARFERQRKTKVSLYDCLNSFSTPEILGEQDLWYCPRCKDHKRATKTIQLWSTGDILTIHLKRFHSARAFSDKIDMIVDFPIEGLDISPYISNPEHGEDIYDLIAVDNHYGGLGGGHYTASVKNFRDQKWYYFNDSRVTEINDPEESISGAAYLLFYRRRKATGDHDDFLGGDKLNELINNGREANRKSLIKKKASLEIIQKQIKDYTANEEVLQKELELDREIEERKLRDAEANNGSKDEDDDVTAAADEEEDEEDEIDGDVAESGENALKAPEIVIKKSRPFDNIKLISTVPSHSTSNSSSGGFNYDNDDVDYEYDEDVDHIRKQRLISKEKNANKLVQIKGDGRQEVASSPISISEYEETDNALDSVE
ncbi:peptidase C19, ubiquitin C-terminal hydrolase 2 [Scheffersomyces coipomensis]|uniref:peptidase C19, ubiquitin C-terminal hydrolase 2 n=1 Tax=Scheffersomyces coipomensis TaxID=1788519 RepID=UPI00315D6C9E